MDTALPTPLERSMWTTPSSPELHIPESSGKMMEGKPEERARWDRYMQEQKRFVEEAKCSGTLVSATYIDLADYEYLIAQSRGFR